MFTRPALFSAAAPGCRVRPGIVLRLLGVDQMLAESTLGPELRSLAVMSVVFGFGGSFALPGMSKWMAKRSTGAKVITQPANNTEAWLVATVSLRNAAGIDYAGGRYLRR